MPSAAPAATPASTPSVALSQVKAVRGFNRFYTQHIGV
ncbi:MAG: MarR family transcriptional regulator, partial [Comamonadaceae bacterium]